MSKNSKKTENLRLSRLTEIPQRTLNRWLLNLSQNKIVKGLESLQGKICTLVKFIGKERVY